MNHTVSYYESIYAKVVLHKGINLRVGQKLIVKTSPMNYRFAQIIAKEAYTIGADYVYIDLQDYALDRERMMHQNDEQLSYVPLFYQNMEQQFLAEDWAYIRIDNTEDRSELASVPTEKITVYQKAIRKSSAVFTTSMMRHEHAWCVICAPGPVWAKQVLGPEANVEDLYKVLIPILRLDEPDPLTAWEEHAEKLHMLSEELTDRDLKEIHISDSKTGTDITIGLRKEARWIGGPKNLPNGTPYFPNIPTEEIFTVPDRLTANGVVYTTKPLTIFGSRVDGCSFTFKEGKVVAYSAAEGEDILAQFLKTDDGASFLGELALVDKNTPIAKSHKIFSSILYDENAACRIALGAGYPACLKNGSELNSEEELQKAGCNTSMLHTDFMIGSPTTEITAMTYGGEKVVIMHEGSLLF